MCDNVTEELVGCRVCVRVDDGSRYYGTVLRATTGATAAATAAGSTGGCNSSPERPYTGRLALHSVRWLAAANGGATRSDAAAAEVGECGDMAAEAAEAVAVPGLQEFDCNELVSLTVLNTPARTDATASATATAAAAERGGGGDVVELTAAAGALSLVAPLQSPSGAARDRPAVARGRAADTPLMSTRPGCSSAAGAGAGAGGGAGSQRVFGDLMDKTLLLSQQAAHDHTSAADNSDDTEETAVSSCCQLVDSSWSADQLQQLAGRLEGLDRVGVAAEGVLLGRHGQLSLLMFCTDSSSNNNDHLRYDNSNNNTIYCIDVLDCDRHLDAAGAAGASSSSVCSSSGGRASGGCGESVVARHFGRLLTSGRVLKVAHDCRSLSDLLWHRHRLQLANVFDTQLAEALLYWRRGGGGGGGGGTVPAHVPNLPHTLVTRLRLAASQVFFPRYRVDRLREDQSAWLHRPLSRRLLAGSVANARHLLSLASAQMALLWSDYSRCVAVYLSCVRQADDEDARNSPFESHRLPSGVTAILGEMAGTTERAPKVPHTVNNVLPGLDTAFQFTRNVWSGNFAGNRH